MSGHNTICTATVILETGLFPMVEPVTKMCLESPAGLIHISADCEGGRVKAITLKNEACFVVHLDKEIEVPSLGKVKVIGAR